MVIFVFLTWAALIGNHADVASSGRRAEEWSGEEGVALGNVVAMRKLSSARMFEDGELNVTCECRTHHRCLKFWKFATVFLKLCESRKAPTTS